jgi:hypothetical protein
MAAVVASPMPALVENSLPASMDVPYAAAESRLLQWRRDLTQTVGTEFQRSLRELCREHAQLTDLHTDLEGARSLAESALQDHADGERLVESNRSSLDAASERAQALARTRDELYQQRDSHLEALRREQQETEQQSVTMKDRVGEAEKLLNTYKDRLGLAITREAPQTVRMSFSLIDKDDAMREFAFSLGLGEIGESYEVRDCEPKVPELPSLLAELNSAAESRTALPRFVCSMRRAFLKRASSSDHKA